MDTLWLHGTPQYFERWANPAVSRTSHELLIPHSFVSMSANLEYALLHKGAHGGLCSARLLPTSRTLDLRIRSQDSVRLWKIVRSTSLGQKYAGLRTADEWHMSCRTGSVLRFAFSSEKEAPELFAQKRVLHSASAEKHLRLQAALYVQNFTREWIETVIGPVKLMGYDAVICNELEKAISATASTQLFIFNVEHLSPPSWVTLPRTSDLTAHSSGTPNGAP